jgi:ABC-type sugar transport system ATPase subunit
MIEVRNLTVRTGAFALKNLQFTIPTNAYCMLMGPTGSGKTTILECICGLKRCQSGSIVLHGRDVTCAKPGERNLGYVPQDGALFPTMKVEDQIRFPLQLRHWSKADTRVRVDELAELLGIRSILVRRPFGLSGGERQRVALARALSFRPVVLCLDEPLSALDEATRSRMCELLQAVHRHEQTTILHVTHSSEESRTLGTQILRIEEGAIKST